MSLWSPEELIAWVRGFDQVYAEPMPDLRDRAASDYTGRLPLRPRYRFHGRRGVTRIHWMPTSVDVPISPTLATLPTRDDDDERDDEDCPACAGFITRHTCPEGDS